MAGRLFHAYACIRSHTYTHTSHSLSHIPTSLPLLSHTHTHMHEFYLLFHTYSVSLPPSLSIFLSLSLSLHAGIGWMMQLIYAPQSVKNLLYSMTNHTIILSSLLNWNDNNVNVSLIL